MTGFDKNANIKSLSIRSCYDPLLGYSMPDNMIPGYDFYPPNARINESDLIVMVLGGSTSTWSVCQWSKVLAKYIHHLNEKAILFNGAALGYTSGQELLKVIRDAPGLKPDIIITLSGVNDLGFMQCVPEYPLLNRYHRVVSNYLVHTIKTLDKESFGIPNKQAAYVNWLRNIRLIRKVSSEFEAKVLCCLQPTSLFGGYMPNKEERLFIEEFSSKTIENVPYSSAVTEFYEGIRKTIRYEKEKYDHVLDLSYLFEGKSCLYKDYRHQNEDGDEVIAKAILDELTKRGWLK